MRSPQHGRTSTPSMARTGTRCATLRRLDAVSVALCSVLDPAALCVAAHECDEWRAAASGAAARVECVMEELNGDAALASAAAACAAANDLPPSARRLADALHAEFSRDGHFAAARALEHQAVQLLFATDFDEGASWLRVPCAGAERVAAAVDAAASGCASIMATVSTSSRRARPSPPS